MDDSLLNDIKAAGVRAFPNEACGVIIADGKKPRVIECRNRHPKPTEYFILNEEDYSHAADEGEVIAIWHTHPNKNSRPTPDDVVYCNRSKLDWFIVGLRKIGDEVTFDGPTLLQPADEEMEYLERPYVYGAYDCYTLVQDYYEREFGITLATYPLEVDWWLNGKDYFTQRFAAEGFEKLYDEEPQIGDVFMMQCGANVPNHLAIYMGNDQILHHCVGRLSRIETYGQGYWRKHTIHHLRHKTKC